jgi:hypothetical protein
MMKWIEFGLQLSKIEKEHQWLEKIDDLKY